MDSESDSDYDTDSDIEPETLQTLCEDKLIENFSLSRAFSCGGTVPGVSAVSLLYKKKSGEWSPQSLQLPGDMGEGERVKEFLEACSTASSGIRGETVIEKDINSLQLEPHSFCVNNFNLESTDILNTIASVMNARASPSFIRAELYKLNVYSTGGHFKAHVDTPRSKEMFGSLVVCLPSQFTGGALVTRHQDHQGTFDWSSSPNATHWASFFSDVEHEVLPVTSGHQVTLTYNLYHSAPISPQLLDVTSTKLYQNLSSALLTPHFMREGGTLGFYCQHKYVETLSDSDFSSQLPFLKGEDMIVHLTAKSLGLSVDLRAICEEGQDIYSIPTFRHKTRDMDNDIQEKGFLRQVFGEGVKSAGDVRWCFKAALSPTPILSGIQYSNDFACKVFYQRAALLVEVPVFSKERGKPVITSQDEALPVVKKFKADTK